MSDILTGTFPPKDLFLGTVGALIEAGNAGGVGLPPAWTAGVIRVVPVGVQPSLVQRWTVLGFSVQIRIAMQFTPRNVFNSQPLAAYGTFGKLYAGLLFDATTSNSGGMMNGSQLPGGAYFPFDLSTFTVVWDGSEDSARVIAQGAGNAPDSSFSLLAETFMFPSPVAIRSGSNMEMALVLTPSVLSPCDAGLIVRSCAYSVIYDDNTNNR